ncbi:MAG: 2Fe-2S iron-sulfur cluster-binding protein, partial [Chloroflexota bacterium]|nr:2Fe-2S iron-sulfur cluster-binding protein [Chloroflexota bacterium]
MDFTLNGRVVAVDVATGESLLSVLRGTCGLRSMKDGCAPEGSCGACTVIVDGRAVVSCAQPAARAAGRTVETLEGLPRDARDLWADAFVATGASQCGYCSPGIVMKAEALLRRDPAPSRESIMRALAGNLCRCTGYASIVDAVELAAGVRRGGPDAPGVSAASLDPAVARYEGRALALGEKPFVADLLAPGMLQGALRFAGVPRAVVRRIDTTRAAAVPGVIAVITAADVPGRREQGLIVADWPQLVAEGETTRYVGDILAAVAAETREAAIAAAELVDVELEPLPPVTDPFVAMEDGAVPIHAGGNLVARSVIQRGDAGAALASAAHVASASFRTQSIEHAFLEPEASLAVPAGAAGPDGRLVTGHRVHVYSEGQGAWEDRRQIASFLA